ncbi:hypothetical protein NEOLEDRAFT_1175025 [Neolentinus lepideus HHB14362 ss-1]|uniref:RING-type domain-containing protein n=1 Tax=Neolentinus lepideus HHB14362 ss-1 TaxID=1314782 RepID=A0A165V8B4_9AGAM|nr:hypothetical protein NEOLEDRAFT_1175025 [Neolentinus lepideus HHB14362 ss-1]
MAELLSFANTCLNSYDRARLLVSKLPDLKREEVPSDECCPICLLTFRSFYEEDSASAMETKGKDGEDGGAERGVTKLMGCGHLFCRKDLNEWILGLHGTCPICRHRFLDIKPPSESDDESSDGGEWLPTNSDGLEEEEDVFMDPDTDAFTDDADEDAFGDVAPSAGDMDFDMEWDEELEVDSEEDWGLTDRDSSMSSEGEFATGFMSAEEDEDNTGIHDGVDADTSMNSAAPEEAK